MFLKMFIVIGSVCMASIRNMLDVELRIAKINNDLLKAIEDFNYNTYFKRGRLFVNWRIYIMIKLDSEPEQQIYMKIISVGCTADNMVNSLIIKK